MYKLYYQEPFTGRTIARQEFTKFKDLKKEWENPELRDYVLIATRELPVLNLPPRPRQSWNNTLDN